MKEYIEIHNKIILPKNLKIELIKGRRAYPKEIENVITEYWNTTEKENGKIFNGRGFSYLTSQIKDDKLIITIQETDFKSYISTNLNPNFDKPDKEMANVLGISTILHTADNKFLMGKRSKFVSEGKNLWHVIGGNLDSPNIVEGMIKELKEEANINKNSLEKILIIGLAKNCRNHRPELLFYIKTSLTSQIIGKDIKESIDTFEHSEMGFFKESQLFEMQFSKETTFTAKAIIKAFFDHHQEIEEV